jgi:hypothetical protein
VPKKIHRQHRDRLAIVYIRQSTVQQVERHQDRRARNTRWLTAPFNLDGLVRRSWSSTMILADRARRSKAALVSSD